MKKIDSAPKFFLASHSTTGFKSVFNYLYEPEKDWFCYILKGGPGTGKSTLMKSVAEKLYEKLKIKYEIICCSSDPDSVDAVVFPEARKCIVDGTAPHTMEPTYPGASDTIINLAECWNGKKLMKQKDKIINLSKQNAIYHKKSAGYLKAFGEIFSINQDIIGSSINHQKLDKFCSRLSKKILKNKFNNRIGKTDQKMISAVTPKGYCLFPNSLNSFAKNLYVIEDLTGEVGNKIIKNIHKIAVSKGYNTVLFPSCLLGENRFDAMAIPEADVAFIINNYHSGLNFSKSLGTMKIHSKRFLMNDLVKNHKNLLNFNFKASKEFLNESVENLKQALEIHDKIEEIYIKSMNYKKVKKITDKLISAIS